MLWSLLALTPHSWLAAIQWRVMHENIVKVHEFLAKAFTHFMNTAQCLLVDGDLKKNKNNLINF